MTHFEHQALTAAVATWLAILAAFFLHLEIPWWSGISAWIVISTEERAVLKQGVQQGIGTIVAALIGYVMALQSQGFVALQVLIIIFATSLGIYMRHTSSAPLAWLLGTLLFLTLIVESIIDQAALLTTAQYRTYEMLTGTTVAAVVAATLGKWRSGASPTSTSSFGASPGRKRPDERTLSHVAMFGSAATIIILVTWDTFDIPNVIPALISVLIVSVPNISSMKAVAVDRAAGCVLGGVSGIFVVAMGMQWLWAWSLALLLGLYLAGLLHKSGRPHETVGTIAGVVFILATVGGDAPQTTLLPAINVVFGITLASVLLWVLLLAVEPWVRKRPPTNEAGEKTAKSG